MELCGFSRHSGCALPRRRASRGLPHTGSLTSLFCATPRFFLARWTQSSEPNRNAYYTRHRAHPYLRKIETAGGWKAYEKAHRTKLLATFVPKFTHLVPKELVPLIVEFSFHVGFY